MMGQAVYYPILRAKAGEFEGYGHLSPPVQALVRPIFDIPKPTKFDMESEQLDGYLMGIVEDIKSVCGTRNSVYIDLSRYDPDKISASGALPIDLIFLAARQLYLPAIPVAGPILMRGSGEGNLPAVLRIAKERNCGAAFRIPIQAYLNSGALSAAIQSVGSELDLAFNQIDLFLDLEGLERIPDYLKSAEQLITYLSLELAQVELDKFRTVVLVGSSVPQTVGPKFAQAPYKGDRIDLQVWKGLAAALGTPELRYGDYGVITPYQNEGSGGMGAPSRVRMTSPEEVISYRGEPKEKHQSVCMKVCQDGEIYRQADSWGRSETIRYAEGFGSPGNSSNWVARDTNMHIETTLRHLLDVTGGATKGQLPAVQDLWEQDSLFSAED